MRRPNREEMLRISQTLIYQFGRESLALLEPVDVIAVELSTTNKVKNVYRFGKRILTRRPSDGLFALTLESGKILKEVYPFPRLRVAIKRDHVAFLSGSVLRPSVVAIDEDLRAGDEVIIVDEDDSFLGVARLRLPPQISISLERGEVARIRELEAGLR